MSLLIFIRNMILKRPRFKNLLLSNMDFTIKRFSRNSQRLRGRERAFYNAKTQEKDANRIVFNNNS